MSKAPIWPVATDALIADTTHLTTEEFGAYMLLMMAQWRSNGAPLPPDERRLARIARLSPHAWERARQVLVELFEVSVDGWRQKRVEKDLVGVIEKIEANRASGSLGGKAKALKSKKQDLATATKSPPATLSESVAIHEPYPEPEKKEEPCTTPLAVVPLDATPQSASAPDPDAKSEPEPEPLAGSVAKPGARGRTPYSEAFQAFWTGYPTDPNMSKKAAFKRWRALSPQQQAGAIASLPAFRAYCDENKSWYRPKHAEGYLSQERFDGFLEASRTGGGGELPLPPDWGDAGSKLVESIGAAAFAQWFGGGVVELIVGTPVRVVADKPFRRNWIAKNYQGALTQAFGADVVIECANDHTTSDRRAIR
jgi:uncharacterized protein YdaU (DUF1376 family)